MPSHQQIPLDKTPLPGAMMPMGKENKMVPPASDKYAHHKPDMVDDGDHDQKVPI